jgi:hypothetical protein
MGDEGRSWEKPEGILGGPCGETGRAKRMAMQTEVLWKEERGG